jgi:hypothetical protein
MPSAQDCAERLREQAYRTLIPQIRELEQELQGVKDSFTAGAELISRKLESLRHIELPASALILNEILEEVVKQKDIENKALLVFMRGLSKKGTQEEILSFLLDSARQFCARVALFAVRGDRLVGWSSRGLGEAAARGISSVSFPYSEHGQFQAALESESLSPISSPGEESPLAFLREDYSGPWNALALQAMGRPVALLLIGGESGNPDALAVIAGLVELRLENTALRILRAFSAAKPAPQQAVDKKVEVRPSPSIPEPLPVISAEAPVLEPEPAEEPAAAYEAALDLESIQKLAREAEAVSIEDAAVSAEAPAEIEEPTQEPVPLPEAMVDQPQHGETVQEEEKMHADAKRFARLLVSEIKLYNEHHVVEGRVNQDLYLRLKRDIDRSREMYESRISPVVSRRIDYFHDEIIRILGDNDPSTLGSDYPGPRVES